MFRTSVGPSYTTPHSLPPALYDFLTANHILGRPPANIFCKIKANCRNRYCKKCRRSPRAAGSPIGSLYIVRLCLGKPHENRRRPPTEMFSKRSWRVAVNTNMPNLGLVQNLHADRARTLRTPSIPRTSCWQHDTRTSRTPSGVPISVNLRELLFNPVATTGKWCGRIDVVLPGPPFHEKSKLREHSPISVIGVYVYM